MSDTSTPERHLLPPIFGSLPADAVAPPPAPARRSRAGLWIGVVAVLLIATASVSVHLWAGTRYDEAAAETTRAIVTARGAQAELSRVIEESRPAVENAQQLRAADNGLLTASEVREAFDRTASEADADAAIDAAAVAASASLPTPPEKPFWAWELLAGAEELRAQTADVEERLAALRAAQAEIADAVSALDEAAQQLAESAVGAVDAFEARHVSALNSRIIDLRLARDELQAALDSTDPPSVEAFANVGSAASSVAASHETVMAGKAGDLLSRRLEVEEYARSIAGGVLLDFEWQQIVNGRGTGRSAGGLATWWAAHGGYATITLSNSVARHWPSPVMRALVAHEVGHAISAKCYEMFDWRDRDANEEWATAWAISMGHTADGNGVSLYGYPRQEIIDRAATCR